MEAETSECPVCLEAIAVPGDEAILTCTHTLHQSCWDQWRDKSDTCPICRTSQTPPVDLNSAYAALADILARFAEVAGSMSESQEIRDRAATTMAFLADLE